jgi:anion-transporting  ArsA/GET3 family ATPase
MHNQSGSKLGQRIAAVTQGKRAVIVCGEGGVGKTTISSLLAYSAAREGKNALVFTIDPARRLKDALGISEKSGKPVLVKEFLSSGGRFWAVSLNVEKVWDHLLQTLKNKDLFKESRLYRLLRGSFPGLSELAAVFSLDDFLQEHDFDTVVIDTAPGQNAINFLLAPERLLTGLEMPFFRIFEASSRFIPSFSGWRDKLGNKLEQLGRSFLGEEVFEESACFSAAISAALPLILEKSERIKGFVTSPDCSVVTVVRADEFNAESVNFFARAAGRMDGVVVNRVRSYFNKERFLSDALDLCCSNNLDELSEMLSAALQASKSYLKIQYVIRNSYGCSILEVADQPSVEGGLGFFEQFFRN